MNEYQRKLMEMPSIETAFCPFCGRPASNRHHIVPRSQGGTEGPTITVCGSGNASGCHKRLHMHEIHLWERDGRWIFHESDEPMSFDDAIEDVYGWSVLYV